MTDVLTAKECALANHDQWPAPGVYANIAYTRYATLPAVNATLLKALAVMTPAKAKHYVLNRKMTPAIEEGICLHTFMLEPERFTREYPLAESCGAILKSGERKGTACGCSSTERTAEGWRCGKHRDAESLGKGITAEFYDRLKVAYREIWRVAGDAMRGVRGGTTLAELTLVWIDPDTGLLCKARLDLFEPADKRIHDLKKTRSADAEVFGGYVGTLGYHIQDAWYRRGAAACFGPGIYEFRFIAVELNENEANGAQVLLLDDEAKQTGEMAAQSSLEVYAKVQELGEWWGYSKDPKMVSLRPWVVRREEALSGE